MMADDGDASLNLVPNLEGYDAFAGDAWLTAAARRAGVEWIAPAASELGRYVASPEAQHHATLANRYTPELHQLDRNGNRADRVEYHPSYHVLMRRATAAGVHSLAWKRSPGGFSARAVLFYLWNQLEQGTACPLTMTFASIPLLELVPALAAEWKPRVLADDYDPRELPVAAKKAALIGMALTEKQGGSDLRTVRTQAVADGRHVRLTGHKWFCSAPMSDGFFTLARAGEGVTCYFVPRALPGGARNAFRLQRLKDKIGNRSNASSEVEFADTLAHPVGEPGRGIATLIRMAHHTRFDIVVGIAGMMRTAFNQALHHATHRAAFGRRLVEQPLMANVLADLALEAQAATLLAFRLAAAFDAAAGDEAEREVERALTPIAKYFACKRMTPVATDALECLGGNGYVEDGPLARLWREAPLNGIWEGSANVICLDVLRALGRSPRAVEALHGLLAGVQDARLVARWEAAMRMLADGATAEPQARRIVEALATCIAASLLWRHADAVAANAYSLSRLGEAGFQSLGTLAAAPGELRAIVEGARVR